MLWGTVAWSFGQHATLWTNEAAYVELGYANINLQNKVASFPQTTTYIAPRLPRPTTWRNTRWNRSWRKFYVCRMVSRYTRIVISLHGCAKRNETYLTQSENQCNRLWQPWLQARMTSLCPKRGKLLAAKGWEVLCVLLLWSFLRCWPKNLWARALTTKVFRNMWFINPVTIHKKKIETACVVAWSHGLCKIKFGPRFKSWTCVVGGFQEISNLHCDPFGWLSDVVHMQKCVACFEPKQKPQRKIDQNAIRDFHSLGK